MDPPPGPERQGLLLTPSCARDTARAWRRSMNECMRCWEAILPDTVRHPTPHGGSDGPPGALPDTLPRRDVLRLRRRLSLRRLRGPVPGGFQVNAGPGALGGQREQDMRNVAVVW